MTYQGVRAGLTGGRAGRRGSGAPLPARRGSFRASSAAARAWRNSADPGASLTASSRSAAALAWLPF